MSNFYAKKCIKIGFVKLTVRLSIASSRAIGLDMRHMTGASVGEQSA